jgi:hypothetical protein
VRCVSHWPILIGLSKMLKDILQAGKPTSKNASYVTRYPSKRNEFYVILGSFRVNFCVSAAYQVLLGRSKGMRWKNL